MAPSRPILSPSDKQSLTANQETDARTALTRGMKEYLESLATVSFGATPRAFTFKRVFDTWPESEDKIQFPSAAVLGVGAGSYDASSFTPGAAVQVLGGTLLKLSELTQPIEITVWNTDGVQRASATMLLESALSPVNFMYGVRLELPHYFNARATYEPVAVDYDDSPEDALRRYRRTRVRLSATVPVIKSVSLPLAAVRFMLVAGDGTEQVAVFSADLPIFTGGSP
jgi:hypothetical protein